MKFQQPLTQAKNEQSFIRIYTEGPDNDCYDGIILCLNDNFLILTQELDYEFEGYVLIPRKQISGYRQSDIESFSQRLMTAAGDLAEINAPDWLTQSETFNDIFSAILSTHPWLRVAWVCPSCDNIHHDVGLLKSCDDDSIAVEIYDNNGDNDGEMGWSMNKVFALEFESKFLKKFGHFIKMNDSTIQ